MRTTVRLDAHLLSKVRQHAARHGTSMTAVFEEALQAYLARPEGAGEEPALDLPRSGHGGPLPGVDLDDTAQLYDVMDAGG